MPRGGEGQLPYLGNICTRLGPGRDTSCGGDAAADFWRGAEMFRRLLQQNGRKLTSAPLSGISLTDVTSRGGRSSPFEKRSKARRFGVEEWSISQGNGPSEFDVNGSRGGGCRQIPCTSAAAPGGARRGYRITSGGRTTAPARLSRCTGQPSPVAYYRIRRCSHRSEASIWRATVRSINRVTPRCCWSWQIADRGTSSRTLGDGRD